MPTQPEVQARAANQQVRSTAHSESIQISAQDISGELTRVLGRQLLAVIVSKSPRTVQRWVDGDTEPGVDDERRMRDAYQIYAFLSGVEGDHTIRAWFMGMNPQLEDVAPAEALAEGRARDAMAAARAFVNGG
ncbi:hypothetical protein [Subtercola lobariae]|uniref:Uncharacterized protein n=1 Tax=Subtercola lobariae TaxID=1588641 RepID=A0A917B3Q9_9MICO|nr:hypothetical protein [Subtercola lobariae]GGF19652.1 hypothetical protein GCM10011399_11580 [Subtercola lobariae]